MEIRTYGRALTTRGGESPAGLHSKRRAVIASKTQASTPLLGGAVTVDKPVSAAATTATLVFAVVVLVVCPVCTVYQFVDDCVTDGCESYTGRRR